MLDKVFKFIERFVPTKYKWVLNHDGFKRYFANTGWMFGGQMFNLGFSFFVGIWIARYLGPENFGILSYSLAFVGLFSFIADLGVNSILNRELIKFPEKRDELLGTALRLKIGGGIIAFLITLGAIFLVETSLLIKMLVLLYAFTFIFQAINVISIFFQARVEAKRNVRAQVISSLISSFFKIVIILSGLGVIWLMLIYVLDSIWLGVFLITSYSRSGFKISTWSFNWMMAKKLLLNSWLLILTSVSISIYTRIDQVMIKQIIGESAVGIYAAASKLSEIWYIIPMSICPSLFSAIVNSKETNSSLYFSRLKKLFFLMFFLSIFIAFFVTIFAKLIVLNLFGSAYLGAASALRVYIWSITGTFVGVVFGQYLVAENYIRIYFYITVIGAAFNIILNLIFIPRLGINGAALSTVFSYIIVILSLLFFKKTRKDILSLII